MTPEAAKILADLKKSYAGFHATLAAKRGEEWADKQTREAMTAMAEVLWNAGAISGLNPAEHADRSRAFLATEYGTYMAKDVLNGVPVARQLEERPARFLKHYAEVLRRTS